MKKSLSSETRQAGQTPESPKRFEKRKIKD